MQATQAQAATAQAEAATAQAEVVAVQAEAATAQAAAVRAAAVTTQAQMEVEEVRGRDACNNLCMLHIPVQHGRVAVQCVPPLVPQWLHEEEG